MYLEKGASTVQKLVIVLAQIVMIAVSAFVLFGDDIPGANLFGAATGSPRDLIIATFQVVLFGRFLLTLFVFLKRSIPWDETVGVIVAFGLYLLGFPLLARGAPPRFGLLEFAGIALFIAGSLFNTVAEYQRHRWKSRPENRGKLYTGGLFSVSIHVNYFGDLLWVTGYACLTREPYAFLIPALLLVFFVFYNVPKLDAHLRDRYGEAFASYEQRTKRLIPFVW